MEEATVELDHQALRSVLDIAVDRLDGRDRCGRLREPHHGGRVGDVALADAVTCRRAIASPCGRSTRVRYPCSSTEHVPSPRSASTPVRKSRRAMRGRPESATESRFAVVWRDCTPSASTSIAAKSLVASAARSSNASSIRTRGGEQFHCTRSAKFDIRWRFTPGGAATFLSRSTATWTTGSSPRLPGPSAARRAEEWLSAAGSRASTAAHARCSQVSGPVWLTYTPRCTTVRSRRRTMRRMSFGVRPRSSACFHETTPACSSSRSSSACTPDTCPQDADAERHLRASVDYLAARRPPIGRGASGSLGRLVIPRTRMIRATSIRPMNKHATAPRAASPR